MSIKIQKEVYPSYLHIIIILLPILGIQAQKGQNFLLAAAIINHKNRSMTCFTRQYSVMIGYNRSEHAHSTV